MLFKRISKNQLEKKCFGKINSCIIYTASLNKNHLFQKQPCKMCEFYQFLANQTIFTQPIEKKAASFADFQQYNLICTKPIAKKVIFQKVSIKKNYCKKLMEF